MSYSQWKTITILLGVLYLPLFLSAQATKKVMIIGIDGCRSDALIQANTPNLDALIANGIFSPDALNEDVTSSGPGWSAILTGVWSAKHGVTNNSFDGSNYQAYPSLFARVENHNFDLHTVSFCHWNPINDQIIQDEADFKLNLSTDAEVASQAVDYLTVNDPDLLFLHFDDVDHAGHAQGFSPDVPAYLAVIEQTDTYVGMLMEAVVNRPGYAEEDWLILVTTDHGGLGTSHGGSSMEERRVFVIASGDSTADSLILRDSTLMSVENCLGEAEELRFDGDNDYVEIDPAAALDFGANQDFSIECRVRTSTPGDVAIVGNKDWNSGFNKGFVFSFKFPSGPEWKINIGDGSNRADINTGGLIADGQWHTLSATFDRDGWLYMYEDGQLIDSTDISGIGDISNGEGLVLGTDINGAFDYNGAIAEVRVWGQVLSPAAIADWHCSSVTQEHPAYEELIGYWKMDEGTGATQVSDASPNLLSGSISGAAWSLPDVSVSYDYSATPRLVDVAVTAMTHLCIPIEPGWELDGNSLIPVCMISSTENLEVASQFFSIYPSITQDQLTVQMISETTLDAVSMEIYDAQGRRVLTQNINSPHTNLNVSIWPAGSYTCLIRIGRDVQQVLRFQKVE